MLTRPSSSSKYIDWHIGFQDEIFGELGGYLAQRRLEVQLTQERLAEQAGVNLWGRTIGAVSLADQAATATFEYDRTFNRSGIEVTPLTMPLSSRLCSFPALGPEMSGLLAESPPDRFGNALIDA